MLIESNKFHKSKFINLSSAVAGVVYSRIYLFTDYFALRKINEQLASENARLKTLEKKSFIKLNARDITVNDTLYRQRYKYLSAKVINSTTTSLRNFLILDKGSEQGIETEMAVISPKGVIGIVSKVSKHYCSVLSVLHIDTRINAMLEDNTYQGIIKWDGLSPEIVKLNDIPQHVQLQVGQEVLTKGSTGLFPKGVLIGHITEFNQVPGSNFYNIKVSLSTNFNAVNYVYIVKNLLKDEQKQLESDFK